MRLTLVIQAWEESERDWGIRPDGYSAHLNEADRNEYIARYWKSQPDGPAPDEYERPSGGGVIRECEAKDEALVKLAVRRGYRFYRHTTPRLIEVL